MFEVNRTSIERITEVLIYVIGIPEGDQGIGGQKTIFEELMAKIIPNMLVSLYLQSVLKNIFHSVWQTFPHFKSISSVVKCICALHLLPLFFLYFLC